MTIEKIKNNIDSKKGNNVKVIYNGSRNKKEEYEGIIKELQVLYTNFTLYQKITLSY